MARQKVLNKAASKEFITFHYGKFEDLVSKFKKDIKIWKISVNTLATEKPHKAQQQRD